MALTDRWCRRGDLTTIDLAVFRIVFALFVLCWSGPWSGLTAKAASFDPPPGPMMLFPELPGAAVLDALGYATTMSAALLLVGLWTRFASASVAVTVMLGQGFQNSFGKIDHPHLLFIVPAVMMFSSWGLALSADSRRAEPSDPPQWPMRLLALMIGLMFFTAGYGKLRGGWLDLDTHAAQGYVLRSFIERDRGELLAPYVVGVTSGAFWEALDWLTVVLELGLVFAALSWRTFRIGVAMAAQFHFGILLFMNLQFGANVIAYGAFVQWQRLLRVPLRAYRIPKLPALIAAIAVAFAAWRFHGDLPYLTIVRSVVTVGALMGTGYLVWLLAGVLRRRKPATSPSGSRSRRADDLAP